MCGNYKCDVHETSAIYCIKMTRAPAADRACGMEHSCECRIRYLWISFSFSFCFDVKFGNKPVYFTCLIRRHPYIQPAGLVKLRKG